jgi:hypothetical protein
MFNIYINDLAMRIKKITVKVLKLLMMKLCVCICMYVALVAETEDNLQDKLKILSEWCRMWIVTINLDQFI